MQAWAPLVLSGAVLLLVSGLPKVSKPGPTITALRSVGATWVGARTVRLLTGFEIGAGLTAVVFGGRWADAAVAALYLGFSIFLLRALRMPAASCGCTGRDDTSPTVAHLVMTAMFALGATAAVVAGGQTGLVTLADDVAPGRLVVAVGLALTTAWLGWSVLTLSLRAPSRRAT